MRTVPSCSSNAFEWYRRGIWPEAPARHAPVDGFHISALLFTPSRTLSSRLPPVASTRPLGSNVPETHMRCDDIDCVGVTTGVGPVMSMMMAALEFPPNCRILPG